jgi:hypothetical protein
MPQSPNRMFTVTSFGCNLKIACRPLRATASFPPIILIGSYEEEQHATAEYIDVGTVIALVRALFHM